MSEMRPCSITDRQTGTDHGWKSDKTTEVFWEGKKLYVFGTSLERIFKRTATDVSTQPTATQ
jgi:hypothetical protein